jgi:hypothetical protein
MGDCCIEIIHQLQPRMLSENNIPEEQGCLECCMIGKQMICREVSVVLQDQSSNLKIKSLWHTFVALHHPSYIKPAQCNFGRPSQGKTFCNLTQQSVQHGAGPDSAISQKFIAPDKEDQ